MAKTEQDCLIEAIKKQYDISKKIGAEFAPAFLRKDIDKLIELEILSGRIDKEDATSLNLLNLYYEMLFDTHEPKLFREFPGIKNDIIPQLIELGLAREFKNNWYLWDGGGPEYGAFVKKMSEFFTVPDQHKDSLLVQWQFDNATEKDVAVLQYAPYREVFINATKKLEASARTANTRSSGIVRKVDKLRNSPKL